MVSDRAVNRLATDGQFSKRCRYWKIAIVDVIDRCHRRTYNKISSFRMKIGYKPYQILCSRYAYPPGQITRQSGQQTYGTGSLHEIWGAVAAFVAGLEERAGSSHVPKVDD